MTWKKHILAATNISPNDLSSFSGNLLKPLPGLVSGPQYDGSKDRRNHLRNDSRTQTLPAAPPFGGIPICHDVILFRTRKFVQPSVAINRMLS